MKMLPEDANQVLDLCRQARQAPTGALAATLLRMTNPTMPPALLHAANDAIFFILCDAEEEGAIPLDQLPSLLSGAPGEDVFVESA